MSNSTVGAHTLEAWTTWDGRNVHVDDKGAVRITTDRCPTYDLRRQYEPPAGRICDVATAPTGGCYLLTEGGDIYRYNPLEDTVAQVTCVWEATGSPRTIAVTRDTIYLAGGADGRVQAIARGPLQTRWVVTSGVAEPLALATCGGEVFLLDGGDTGSGFVSAVDRHGRVRPIVTGLLAPRDLAGRPDGTIAVLESVPGGDRGTLREPVLRCFDTDSLVPSAPVDATDSVRIAPNGFRRHGRETAVHPTCVALGPDREVLIGSDRSDPGDAGLLRYRHRAATLEPQPGHDGEVVALAAATDENGTPTAYVIDEAGGLTVVRAEHHYRTDDDGSYAGRIVSRFDGGEARTQWDGIELDRTLEGSETAVEVRYVATDEAFPPPASTPPGALADVTSIDGIGPTYGDRLANAGVEIVEDLAALSAEALQTIVSVEEYDVPVSDAVDWIDRAKDRLASGDDDLEAVDGIGDVYAARLRAAGIESLAKLVESEPVTVSRYASASRLTVPRETVTEWLSTARLRLGETRTYAELDWQRIRPANPRKTILHNATGRYLWVEIELLGTRDDSPTITGFRATFPRDSATDFLPAIYREDATAGEFTERFVALFESVFEEIEAGIDSLPSYVDPVGAPDDPAVLKWLGQWLAVDVDDSWPSGFTRAVLARAPEIYRMRGTRRGLLAMIQLYLEHVEVSRRSWEGTTDRESAHLDALVDAGALTRAEASDRMASHERLAGRDPEPLVTVLEYAAVAAAAEPAREPFERLIECPAGFLVLLHPAVPATHVRSIARLVTDQQPAHASGQTVGLARRVELTGESPGERGFHTYLGVNSVLPNRTFELAEGELGRETVLAGREPDGVLDLQARLNEDARLS